MGIQEVHTENTPTEPDGSSLALRPGRSSRLSFFGHAANTANVMAALGVFLWTFPWAAAMYEKGDWKPLAGLALAVVMVCTKSGLKDLGDLVGRVKGGSK